jgi:hypothetical protein
MATERSCVDPFIKRIQAVLQRTGSLRISLREISSYQIRSKRIYKVDVHFVHALAVSTISLGILVLYEYLRSRGSPLPDSRALIRKIMPAKNLSDEAVFGKLTDDKRHEEIDKETNRGIWSAQSEPESEKLLQM